MPPSFAPDARYELGPVVGRGGTGVVHRATDRLFGRDVALKRLHAVDPRQVMLLKHEFRVLTGIVHPNLVQLYDLVVAEQGAFFTMEFVEGTDVVTWLRGDRGAWQAPTASPEEVARLFHQVASALHALHARGRVHRDVKPANVLCGEEGRPVVLDFGFATPLWRAQGSTETDTIVGTVSYMAPEQAMGELTPTADLYSLGVMLYEALTGTLPFQGSAGEVLLLRRTTRPPHPRVEQPAADPRLSDLAMAMMEPSPWSRPPTEEILARLAEIASSPLPAFPSGPAEAPFVGRAAELAWLDDALAAVREGQPVLAEVVGPTGIGKTELVHHWLTRVAPTVRPLVLASRCHPHEVVPFNALDAAVDGLAVFLASLGPAAAPLVPPHAASLLRLFPVLAGAPAFQAAQGEPAPVDPAEARRQGVAALRWVLRGLAERRRLVVWIDDVQWADADSVGLLRALLWPPEAPAVLVVMTVRTGDAPDAPRHAPLGDLGTLSTRLALGNLSRAEAGELAERLGAPPGAAVPTELSPFLVGELARYSVNAGAAAVTPTSAEAIRWRADQFGERAGRLLRASAVALRPLAPSLVLAAAGCTSADLPMVYRLVDACLLRVDPSASGTGVGAYHDQVREALLRSLPDGERRDQHRQLARALEEAGGEDPVLLFEHWRGAGEAARAAVHGEIAARRAEATLAFGAAADLYAAVHALRGASPDAALERRVATCLQNAGRTAEAATWYERAAASAGEGEPGRALLARAAEQHLHVGSLARGRELLATVLTGAGQRIPASAGAAVGEALWGRLRFLLRSFTRPPADPSTLSQGRRQALDDLWGAGVGFSIVSFPLSAALSMRHLHLALDTRDPSHLSRALALEAAQESLFGAAWIKRRCVRLLDRAVELAVTSGDPYDTAQRACSLAATSWAFAEWRACADAAAESQALLGERCAGVDWEVSVNEMYRLAALVFLGELEEVRSRCAEGLERARRRGDRFATTIFELGEPAVARVLGGEAAGALADADAAIAAWPALEVGTQHYHHLVVTAHALLQLGRAEEALARLEDAWPRLQGAQLFLIRCTSDELHHLRARVHLACARRATGSARASHLARALADGKRIGKGGALRWSRALSLQVRGLHAASTGDDRAAALLLGEAEAAFTEADMRVYAAATLHRLGLATRDADTCAAAVATLQERGVADVAASLHTLAPISPAA